MRLFVDVSKFPCFRGVSEAFPFRRSCLFLQPQDLNMPVMGGHSAARAITTAAAERGLWLPPMAALTANVAKEARFDYGSGFPCPWRRALLAVAGGRSASSSGDATTPSVVATAFVSPQDERTCFEAGMARHLVRRFALLHRSVSADAPPAGWRTHRWLIMRCSGAVSVSVCHAVGGASSPVLLVTPFL